MCAALKWYNIGTHEQILLPFHIWGTYLPRCSYFLLEQLGWASTIYVGLQVQSLAWVLEPYLIMIDSAYVFYSKWFGNIVGILSFSVLWGVLNYKKKSVFQLNFYTHIRLQTWRFQERTKIQTIQVVGHRRGQVLPQEFYK